MFGTKAPSGVARNAPIFFWWHFSDFFGFFLWLCARRPRGGPPRVSGGSLPEPSLCGPVVVSALWRAAARGSPKQGRGKTRALERLRSTEAGPARVETRRAVRCHASRKSHDIMNDIILGSQGISNENKNTVISLHQGSRGPGAQPPGPASGSMPSLPCEVLVSGWSIESLGRPSRDGSRRFKV